MLGPDGARGKGLEIGALHAPLLPKPEHDVLYVDYAPTEVVRANQFDPAIDPADIVEVDIVWGERPLREAVGGPVDYVVASHVIEHVPDLIGWLAELHQALRPGGTLGLAIPDKRYTFDALRKDSTVAEAVEANLMGYRQPSLRQVFDVAWLGVAIDAGKVWAGDFDPGQFRAETLDRLAGAYRLAQKLAQAPRYNDAHCWVFTPDSFLDLAEELAVLGAFPFTIEAFHRTEPGQIEFQTRLKALPDGGGQDALASIRAARAGLSNATVPETTPAPGPTHVDAELQALAAENCRLRQHLDAVQASTSWRITAPVRAIARLAAGRPKGKSTP